MVMLRSRMVMSGLATALLLPVAASAQASAFHFDVVPIKENHSGAQQGLLQISPEGDRVLVTNSPMYRIVAFAFDRQRNDLVEGMPDWAREERWDIEATIAPEDVPAFHAMTFAQQKVMLQSILVERCKMRAHAGKKVVSVFALVVAKEGSKLREAKPSDSNGPSSTWDIKSKRGEIHGRAVPMAALIYALAGISPGRPVIDKTGLTGVYDFDLAWNPEDASEAAESGPSLFTAMQQQLGLHLDPAKAPVDAVIVEHIERPTQN